MCPQSREARGWNRQVSGVFASVLAEVWPYKMDYGKEEQMEEVEGGDLHGCRATRSPSLGPVSPQRDDLQVRILRPLCAEAHYQPDQRAGSCLNGGTHPQPSARPSLSLLQAIRPLPLM